MILIGAQDAGPANYLAKIVPLINIDAKCFSSEISKSIFQRHNITSESLDLIPSETRLVITGTTLGDSIDKELIRYALRNQIPSVSIIEHWNNFNERFVVKNNPNLYPVYIFVNDEDAKKKAVYDGLPENKLVVVGNPVLEEKQFNKVNTEEGSYQNKSLLFISEDLTTHLPETGSRHLGYNQFDVISDLISASKGEWIIDIKMHPAESAKDYYDFLKNKEVTLVNYDKMMAEIGNYKVILGMESMLLMEFALMGLSVYSYRPKSNRTFFGIEAGWVIDLSNEELRSLMNGNFKSKKIQKAKPEFRGSANRIVKVIRNIYENNSIYSG